MFRIQNAKWSFTRTSRKYLQSSHVRVLRFGVKCTNVELLKVYHKLVKNKRLKPSANLELILRKKKIRSLSDIVNVSVLTKLFCIQNTYTSILLSVIWNYGSQNQHMRKNSFFNISFIPITFACDIFYVFLGCISFKSIYAENKPKYL